MHPRLGLSRREYRLTYSNYGSCRWLADAAGVPMMQFRFDYSATTGSRLLVNYSPFSSNGCISRLLSLRGGILLRALLRCRLLHHRTRNLERRGGFGKAAIGG